MRARQLLALALPLFGACAHAPPTPALPPAPPRDPRVSYDIIPAASSAEYQLAQGQHAFGALPITNDPPAYPATLMASNLPPQVVHAKVIVDAYGKVSDVRDLDAAVGSDHLAFFAATRDAAMHWRYTPMTLVKETRDSRGYYSEDRTTAAFSLDYAFRFEMKDGVPSVSTTH